MIVFPTPNDRIGNRTVIASVWYGDEAAMTILLAPEPPFFEVVLIYLCDNAFGDERITAGQQVVVSTHYNIVNAVRSYEENGGDI